MLGLVIRPPSSQVDVVVEGQETVARAADLPADVALPGRVIGEKDVARSEASLGDPSPVPTDRAGEGDDELASWRRMEVQERGLGRRPDMTTAP